MERCRSAHVPCSWPVKIRHRPFEENLDRMTVFHYDECVLSTLTSRLSFNIMKGGYLRCTSHSLICGDIWLVGHCGRWRIVAQDNKNCLGERAVLEITNSPSRRAPCKGGAFQWVQIPPGEMLQPEATGATKEVTKWLKPSVKRAPTYGGSASVQAATRVNAEQSSKSEMRRTTRLSYRGSLLRPDG